MMAGIVPVSMVEVVSKSFGRFILELEDALVDPMELIPDELSTVAESLASLLLHFTGALGSDQKWTEAKRAAILTQVSEIGKKMMRPAWSYKWVRPRTDAFLCVATGFSSS